jgi:hypothetical protein
MAAFNKFNSFVADCANKVHNLASDTLQIALCASANAPVATNTVLANLTQASYTNLSSQVVTTTSSIQTGGLYKLICQDLVMTASGAVGPFRYAVLFNQTSTNDALIGFWDYGADTTLAAGETFTVDLDQVNGVLQLQ